MLKALQVFTLGTLLASTFACGSKSGSSPAAPPPAEPLPEEEALQFTEVPAEFFRAAFPEGYACTDYQVAGSLPSKHDFAAAPLPLTLGVWDWSQGTSASRIYDNGQRAIHIWQSDSQLQLGLAGEAGAFDDVEVSFYGFVEKADELLIEKVVSYDLSQFQLLQNDPTLPIHKAIYAMPLADLGSVLHWPNFIVQVKSQALLHPVLRFYVGVLEAAEGPYSPGICQEWLRRHSSLYLQTLMSRSEAKAERATKAASIMREALEDAFTAFGPGWSQAQVPTIFSDLPVKFAGFVDAEAHDFTAVIRTEKLSTRYSRDDGHFQAYTSGLLGYWRNQLAGLIGPSYSQRDLFVVDTLSHALVFNQITSRFERIHSMIQLEQSLHQDPQFPGAVVLGWGLAQIASAKDLAALLADRQTLRGMLNEESLLNWMTMNFANLDQQKTWGTMHGSWVKLSVAEALLDQDDDSLSDLMEIFTDSLATKKDSDGDLWSDYAEYISGTSPLDRHERPKVLVQDGDLVDWFELLPTKIREATNIPNQCDLPDVMDWYGAVAEEDRLLLAVHRKDGSRLPGYDWLVQIQIPVLNQLFSLRLSGDPGAHGNTSQDITVLAEESIRLEGKPESKQQEKFLTYQGRVFSEKGLELAFDPLKFGIPNLNLLQGGAVQVQISLLKGHGKKELLCGQTPWFSPVARTL